MPIKLNGMSYGKRPRTTRMEQSTLHGFIRNLSLCMDNLVYCMNNLDDQKSAVLCLKRAISYDRRTALLWYRKNRKLVSHCSWLLFYFQETFGE